MKTIITKSGKKLIFRPLCQLDLQSVYTWVKVIEKEDTFILLNYREPNTLKDEQKFITSTIKDIKAKKQIFIGVFDKHKYIGSCSIEKLGKRQGHLGRFGIALLKPYRGEGVGRQLADYVIQLAKEKLKLKQIILKCFTNNQVGQCLYKKLGFKQYGVHPQAILYKGKYIDETLFYKDL
jgi:RimJ/RimL family protein N-acetyltransferase